MSWSDARDILCVRLDQLGDLLMTTPAIRAVRGNRERRVTLLTSSAGAIAARHIPEVSEIIVYDPPWMKHSPSRQDAGEERKTIDTLRSRRFDAGIIFTVFSQSALPAALLLYLAEIPLRLAFSRENPYELLTDWRPDTEPARGIRHEVQRQLDLVRSVGWNHPIEHLSFAIPPIASQRAISSLRDVDRERPWLIAHPGASAASRRYPPHLFAEALKRLMNDGWQIIFTGSHEEIPLVEGIRDELAGDTLSLAGHLTLPELAAVIEQAPLLLTNNTGPSHIAAAVGTPVVTLYALTNPQHTPWQVPSLVLSHDVPCRDCFKSVCPEGHNHCLSLIDPHRVAEACVHLFETTQEPFYGEAYAHTRN